MLESSRNERYKHLYRLTKGLVFFGIPYGGLRTKELEKSHKDIDAQQGDPEEERWRRDMLDLIQQLGIDSNYLEELRDNVPEILSSLAQRNCIISFYETVRTRTVHLVSFSRSLSLPDH